MQNIQIDDLDNAINGVLEEYKGHIIAGVKTQSKKAMKDLVKNTKATAPVGKRSKHYRDSISSKTLNENAQGISLLWYVRGSDYRLSHLLNNGHALRNGGRYPGTNFIGKAVDHVLPWYTEKIKEIIENG